jgi:hypothetical protein
LEFDFFMNTEIDPENQTLDAFVESFQGEAWRNQELGAWTPAAQIAAQSMGMIYPAIGDEGYDMLERTGVYPGALRDVIIFLWLRLQKPSDILRAQRKPAEAWRFAQAWAETEELIDMAGPGFRSAYELFAAKFGAVAEATGEPETKAPSGSGNV